MTTKEKTGFVLATLVGGGIGIASSILLAGPLGWIIGLPIAYYSGNKIGKFFSR